MLFFPKKPKTSNQIKLRRKLQERQTADFYYLIDVVGTCNLKCPSCPVGNYPIGSPKGVMPVEQYEAILEKIQREHPGEKIFVDLYNWGEPGLHKNLSEIIRLTKAKNYGVGISTNLNMFTDMTKVVKESPSYIRISLSGYFNNVYKQTHRHGDINTVKANMHLLRQKIDQYKSDAIVQVGFHIYKHNFKEDFWKMKTLCEDLDFIFAPTLAALMPAEKAIKDIEGDPLESDKDILDKIVVPMKTRTEFLSHLRSEYSDCQYRSIRTTINFDGSVPLCCATFEDAQIIAPNFMDVSRKEIQTRKYKHDFCKKCQKCSLDMVYTNVEPKHVEDYAVKILGNDYRKFLKEWNVPIESVVEWQGEELSAQKAYDLYKKYKSKNDTTNAKQLLIELCKSFPRHGEALFNLGEIYQTENNLDMALKHFQSALSILPKEPKYIDAVNNLLQLNGGKNDY